jgi:DNA processing protein
VDQTLDKLTLVLLPGVGPRTARDLLARGPLADLLARPDDHGDLLGLAARQALQSGAARRRAEDEGARAERLGVRLVPLGDPSYPPLLACLYDPPAVLWVRGQLTLEDEGPRSVAIVGSRAATPAGTTLARALARELAGAGLTVVSGLARGIDAAAHRGALEGHGRTVAILGSGLDRLYPPEHTELAEHLVRHGALISEFPLGTRPERGHFPRRNRLIAGWSRGVVVVEATEKSGALGTARVALDEGREVFAVPGHPSSAQSVGTNALIRDGAVLVRNAADVAAELGFAVSGEKEERNAEPILSVLRREVPTSLEQLVQDSGRSVPDLLAQLSRLELTAQVRRLPGPLFVRA